MRWKEPLVLKVQILSPVAIGTGERCNALGFVVEGNRVLVVDGKRLIAALAEINQEQKFLSWLDECLSQNRRPKLKDFLTRLEVNQHQQKQILRKAVAYTLPSPTLAQRMHQFNFCLKTPDHRPYIPGSELKGAMRTAVLNMALQGKLLEDLSNSLTGTAGLVNEVQRLADEIRQIEQQLRSSPDPEERARVKRLRQEWRVKRDELGRELRRIWQESEWKLLRNFEKGSDAHYDLFRGISVSDSEPMPTERLRIYAAKRLGMSRDLTVFVEAIAQGSETTVTLSVAKPDRWLEKIGLTDKGGWLDWGKLARALYEHADSVLDFIAQKFPQISGRARELKSKNEPEAPLLCIGWGQGFLSVTMTDGLRRQYPQAYEALRQAMAQAISQYGRTKPNNFPKTVWVALDERNQPADLFGWVKLTPQG